MPSPDRHGLSARARRQFGIIGALIILVVGLSGLGVAGAVSSSAPVAETGYSVAYKLATIDCRCTPTRAQVKPYAQVLNILSKKKCRESQSKIGDMAVLSTQLLRKKGIRMSTLTVLRGVNRSIPASLGRTRCSDIFAAFVILVENN